MTIENHKTCPSSRREQTLPDRTLYTVKALADERLSWDCATVGVMMKADRPSARARVELKLGDQLARVLLAEAAIRPPETDAASLTDAA